MSLGDRRNRSHRHRISPRRAVGCCCAVADLPSLSPRRRRMSAAESGEETPVAPTTLRLRLRDKLRVILVRSKIGVVGFGRIIPLFVYSSIFPFFLRRKGKNPKTLSELNHQERRLFLLGLFAASTTLVGPGVRRNCRNTGRTETFHLQLVQ